MSRKFLVLTSMVLALAVLAWGVGPGWAAPPDGADKAIAKTNKVMEKAKEGKLRKEAAKRARALGLKPGVAGVAAGAGTTDITGMKATMGLMGIAAAVAPLPGIEGPGGIPHYFGPYGNWAYSPLPRGPVAVVTLVDGGTGYNNPLVTIDDAYGTGASVTFPATQVGGVVQPITITAPGIGADFSAPIATITDNAALCGGVPPQLACGTGATADAIIGFTLTGGMAKFVDSLPGLTPAGANNLGQYIPVGVADTRGPSGADYYEIALVEFNEQMHSGCRRPSFAATSRSRTPGSSTTPPGSRPRSPLPGVSTTAPRSTVTTTPITWGPSSWQRGAHMA